jgi:hypothetical protein
MQKKWLDENQSIKSDDVVMHLLSASALRQQVNRANKKNKPIVKPKYLKDLVMKEFFYFSRI